MTDGYGTPEQRYKGLAEIYDDLAPFNAETAAAVSFLEKIAPAGRVLELAVGTGRVAIPLAERGCDVTGVDASPDMLRVLGSKDRDGKVRALQADMAALSLEGEFDLIYIVANSLLELHTQELQVACVKSAARLLCDGGSLVVETVVANHIFADQRPLFVGSPEDLNSVTLHAVQYDHLNQVVQYRHIFMANDSIKVLPSVHRLIYLPELDLMATLAGLELTARHADWAGGKFNAESRRHISVYAKG